MIKLLKLRDDILFGKMLLERLELLMKILEPRNLVQTKFGMKVLRKVNMQNSMKSKGTSLWFKMK